MARSAMKPDLKETITQLGLEYRLMTQFTSFVAVEEMVVTDHGQPRRIDVPVEVPEGVNAISLIAMIEWVRCPGLRWKAGIDLLLWRSFGYRHWRDEGKGLVLSFSAIAGLLVVVAAELELVRRSRSSGVSAPKPVPTAAGSIMRCREARTGTVLRSVS